MCFPGSRPLSTRFKRRFRLHLNCIEIALALAAVATVLEALPTDDLDNIILPAGVGLIATILLQV